MRRAWHALAAYTVATVAATWPLATGLARDVAWDIGDSALNMWVLSWDCEQLLAIVRGDFARIGTFFDGNIFHPAPLTLAYAEHLFPQALQILPVYALTRNPILCYNVLFLSTFVLSGLGAYLFVRELTGNPGAAFVVGLLFAFAPYRVSQAGHLQVLSLQWMPFALYGFRRFFLDRERGRSGRWPLAGATLALVAQNLSCGYYLLYVAPFAVAYVLWEIVRGGFVRHLRVWVNLIASATVVLVATLPFLLPYAALHQQFGFKRPASEVARYSADVYSYATAMEVQAWGSVLREYPKPEGELFPGVVPIVLALIALITWRGPSVVPSTRATRIRWLAPALAAAVCFHLLLAFVTLLNRRVVADVAGLNIQITDINQLLVRAGILAAALLASSPIARARVRAFMSERGFFLVMAALAVWLSFGPAVEVRGRPANLVAPYSFLFDHVPGFDGVRVPARFGMIGALLTAILAGYGAAAVIPSSRRRTWVIAGLTILILAESLVFPFRLNQTYPPQDYKPAEPRLYRPARAPAVYRTFASQGGTPILAELPLGEPELDRRAVYYSTAHWRPLLNGYSGFYPPDYRALTLSLSDVPRFPDEALRALRVHGATHVIVHEGAYLGERGLATTAALLAKGAREVFRDGSDVLLQLPAA